MFKKAFTMAEVLTVIAIIGVVAALTLPNLTNNTEQERTVAQVRKVYNELNDAFSQSVVKYGNSEDWRVDNDEKLERYVEFLELSRTSNVSFPYASYNGNDYSKFELKDGTLLSIKDNNIYIATNGLNGATLGEYIFGFYVDSEAGKIYPLGYKNDRNDSGKFTASGIYSTNWVIANGNLDYLKCSANLNWNNKLTCK